MEPTTQLEPEQKTNGALLGSIIIVIILIVGGIYLWRAQIKEKQNREMNDVGLENTDRVSN